MNEPPEQNSWRLLIVIAAIGFLMGTMRELAKAEGVAPMRVILAKGILTAGLAMGAGAIEIALDAPLSEIELIGLSCLLATIGVEGLLRLLQRKLSTGGVDANRH